MSDKRRAELHDANKTLHDAYMATEPGSPDERTLELAIIANEELLDELSCEEQAQWIVDAHKALREKLRTMRLSSEY